METTEVKVNRKTEIRTDSAAAEQDDAVLKLDPEVIT